MRNGPLRKGTFRHRGRVWAWLLTLRGPTRSGAPTCLGTGEVTAPTGAPSPSGPWTRNTVRDECGLAREKHLDPGVNLKSGDSLFGAKETTSSAEAQSPQSSSVSRDVLHAWCRIVLISGQEQIRWKAPSHTAQRLTQVSSSEARVSPASRAFHQQAP